MRYQHPALVAVLLGLSLASCKKDVDGTPPSVSIVAPATGSTVTVPETLAVTVTASDDERVERITVTLVNVDGIPVVTGAGSSPITNPATVTIGLPVTSEMLESGNYSLMATATDGTATARDTRPITLVGAPFRLRAVFAVTAPVAGQVGIYRIDSVGTVGLATTLTTDLGGAAVSSHAQLLYLCGAVTGPVQALSPDGFASRWVKPNPGAQGAPWFTALDRCADGRLYIGTDEGELRGYEEGSGSGAFVADLTNGYRTERTTVVGDLVVSAERHLVTGQRRIASYQQASGSPVAQQVLDKAPIALFERDAAHVLIFGNRSGQGVVEDRFLQLGGSWEPHTWPAEITAVAHIGGTTWLVALANGDLVRFTYTDAGSITIASGPVVHDLAFDPAHGVVFAATDGQVLAIDPQSGSTQDGFTVPGNVRYVLPLFNREP